MGTGPPLPPSRPSSPAARIGGPPSVPVLLSLFPDSGPAAQATVPPAPGCVLSLCFLLAFISINFSDSSDSSRGGAACALTHHAFPESPAALPPSLSGISAAPKSGAQGVVTSVASRTGSSEGVSLLRALAGVSGPSVLVASHGTSEACRGPFPVCGLCLSNAALSFLVQRGFPPSLPITEISRRPTLSLTKPRTAGGRALPCTLWLGLVLSSFQEQEGHVFLLFFFFFFYKWRRRFRL